jgi:hypothetical protein
MSEAETVTEAVKIYDGLVLDALDFLAERLGWDDTAVLVHALLIRDVAVEAMGLENTDGASDQLRDARDRIIARMTTHLKGEKE